MVDASLAVFRLLELIALLFPVVALLVQLQHRAADSAELQVLGLFAGLSLLLLLSLSFLQLNFYLVSAQSLPTLLTIPLLVMSFLSLLLPLLIVLSSEQFTERAKEVPSAMFALLDSIWRRRPIVSDTARSDRTDPDVETDHDED